ncbi:MAG TPA: iron-sulfur cluster loop [Coriobacteriia bacterium]|nr:iron-sulfur cluster loop [Coriobacteriia bacterium]
MHSRTSGDAAGRRNAVAAVLIDYGRELERDGAAQVGGSFTGNADADRLLAEEPNAFLIGTLFTQGIPAERAWSGPYLLKQRLGSFSLEALADKSLVSAAVQTPPMLHRFKKTLPAWIVSAARRLARDYDGNAARIWAPGSSVVEVVGRLSAFDGIGRKKAVMATEILMRHFGVELTGRERGSVAYDVHVRRVFLRSGLVDHDDRDAIEAAAASLCPASPGTLDLPAWLIGRDSCRPKTPSCDSCRLGDVCPRLVDRNVTGVGVRARS